MRSVRKTNVENFTKFTDEKTALLIIDHAEEYSVEVMYLLSDIVT